MALSVKDNANSFRERFSGHVPPDQVLALSAKITLETFWDVPTTKFDVPCHLLAIPHALGDVDDSRMYGKAMAAAGSAMERRPGKPTPLVYGGDGRPVLSEPSGADVSA
ncbi:hypothetical protein [Streptomyces sp. NBC_00258]|jgi:hypothetical protein|uniref:hypothetical protein n=1 Tax=Streptomyces sp. NBC_00258 TaxID=2903642 RepID=UPI002E2CDBD1|nr:hypothetical protein [Streptomyces sp. NBC_00258]